MLRWHCLGNPLSFGSHAISHRPAPAPSDNVMPSRPPPASPMQFLIERPPDAVRFIIALSQQCINISLPPHSTPARVRPVVTRDVPHRSPASLTQLRAESHPGAVRCAVALSRESIDISLPPYLTPARIPPIATARRPPSIAHSLTPTRDRAPTWRCPLCYGVVSVFCYHSAPIAFHAIPEFP